MLLNDLKIISKSSNLIIFEKSIKIFFNFYNNFSELKEFLKYFSDNYLGENKYWFKGVNIFYPNPTIHLKLLMESLRKITSSTKKIF